MRFASALPLPLRPKLLTIRNLPRSEEGTKPWRAAALAILGLGFWFIIFFGTRLFVQQCLGVELLGELIARKLLDFVFVTFFSILVMSNINTAFSTFYLADDLALLNAMPIRGESLFFSRFVETLANSSWHVLVFGTPVIVAYGVAFQAHYEMSAVAMVPYYLSAAAVFLPFFVIPTAIAVVMVTALVNVFPARRLRELTLLLFVMMFSVMLLYIRFLQPERFLNPEGFQTFQRMLADFRPPGGYLVPSAWLVETLFPRLKGAPPRVGFLVLTVATGLFSYFAAWWFTSRLYGEGYSRAQEGKQGKVSRARLANGVAELIALPYRGITRQFVLKDVKLFLREPTQWTQLLLLLALVFIYILNAQNFRSIGSTGLIKDRGLHFLNTGLIAFMSTSVAVRFVYPAVSLEGRAYWIVRTAPLSIERFLWGKFYVYFVPLLVVSLAFALLSGYFIGSPIPYRLACVATVAATTVLSTGMGIGFGALFPRFHVENVARIAQGYGGMIYMLVCMTTIIVIVALTAFPISAFLVGGSPLDSVVYSVPMAWGAIGAILVITVVATVLPVRFGARSLAAREGP